MIAIVDYRAGNLVSVKKAVDHLGFPCAITSDPDVVERAEKVIVPGVGHFAATSALDQSGLRAAITSAIGRQIPFFGICVGMQWMFDSSEEAPGVRGLAVFAGQCSHFPPEVKSPHVGWNQLEIKDGSRLLRGVPSDAFVYFTHSYRAPLVADTVACCDYGGAFSAAVERDHLFGVQFHPEKSGDAGLAMLENFCRI
ncbi:MAG TPA: imidazole glycerol phosphate synthase subunit HisH [Bryobacteraceae bacterium]|nr:imidazole glycerol phosphate synthase subunit HisH [Bryobacteraceae bacterium]